MMRFKTTTLFTGCLLTLAALAAPLQAQTPTPIPSITPTPISTIPAPVLNSPEDGAVFFFDQLQQNGGLTLTWNAVPGAGAYRVVYQGPPQIPFDEREVFVTDPERPIEVGLLPVGNYTWNVQAYQSTEVFSQVSETRSFQVRLPTAPTATPIIVDPDVDRSDDVNLYDFFLVASAWKSEFGTPDYQENADFFPDGEINEQDLGYFLRPWREGTDAAITPLPFATPELVFPPDGTHLSIADFNDRTPNFEWTEVTDVGVTGYELRLDTPGTTINVSYPSATNSVDVIVTNAGEYNWRVRAKDASGGSGPWSPRSFFELSFLGPTPTPTPTGLPSPTPAPLAAPELEWPTDGESVSFIAINNQPISWKALAGADEYQFSITGENNRFFDIPTSNPRVVDGTSTLFLVTFPDTYNWQVRGVLPDGTPGEWSEIWSFTAGQ